MSILNVIKPLILTSQILGISQITAISPESKRLHKTLIIYTLSLLTLFIGLLIYASQQKPNHIIYFKLHRKPDNKLDFSEISKIVVIYLHFSNFLVSLIQSILCFKSIQQIWLKILKIELNLISIGGSFRYKYLSGKILGFPLLLYGFIWAVVGVNLTSGATTISSRIAMIRYITYLANILSCAEFYAILFLSIESLMIINQLLFEISSNFQLNQLDFVLNLRNVCVDVIKIANRVYGIRVLITFGIGCLTLVYDYFLAPASVLTQLGSTLWMAFHVSLFTGIAIPSDYLDRHLKQSGVLLHRIEINNPDFFNVKPVILRIIFAEILFDFL